MKRAALGLVAIAACFTGDSAQGLPCTADEFCAGLKCVDGYCGGPPEGSEPTSGTPTSTTTVGTTTQDTTTDDTLSTTSSSPTGTTEVDTTSSESTGTAQPCTPMGGWDQGDFSLNEDDRFDSSSRPIEMVVARLDGDEFPDVVTANIETQELELRRGESPGTFAELSPYRRPLDGQVDELIAGAIDQESHGDLVVIYGGLAQMSIFLWSAGAYVGVEGQPFDTGMQPRRPVIFDFDGAGLPDIAFATMEGLEVYTSVTGEGVQSVLLDVSYLDDLARVTFDGADALLGVHYAEPGEVALYRPTKDESALEELRDVEIDQAGHAAGLDFDQDGDADVIVIGQDGRVWLLPSFLEPDDGALRMIGSFAGMGAPLRYAIGQLDGECGLDLAVLANGEGVSYDVVMMRYEGDSLSEPFLLGADSTNAIQAADLDGNGTDELVLASDGQYVQIVRYSP